MLNAETYTCVNLDTMMLCYSGAPTMELQPPLRYGAPKPEEVEKELVAGYIETIYADIDQSDLPSRNITPKDNFLNCDPSGCICLAVTDNFHTPCYTECVAFSPDGNLLACCCYDEILVYDTQGNHKEPMACLEHEDNANVWRCCFNPKHPELFSVCGDGKLYIWDTTTWSLKQTIHVSKECIFGLCINDESDLLAISGYDKIIHIFDIENEFNVY